MMRKVITTISIMLFGASILIFASALLIPLRNESASRGPDSKTEFYESSDAFKKTIEKSAPNQTQNPVAVSKLEASITQFESELEQNESAIDSSREDSGANPSLQAAPETTAPRIHEGPSEPVNSMALGKKHSPRHEPISLLVIGDGLFPPGAVRPKADAQEAIDKIISLIQDRPFDNVIVEGHADKSIPGGFNSVQASKWNRIISVLRAKSVARILEQKGIARDRIIFKGLGDADPVASNLTWEGRAKNRRVEIKLSPAQ